MVARLIFFCGALLFAFITPLAVKAETVVKIDEKTAGRGFVVSTDDLFRLHLPPKSVSANTIVSITRSEAPKIDAVNGRATSDLYTIEINDPKGATKIPLWVEFTLDEENPSLQYIAAYHRDSGLWQKLPIKLGPQSKTVRAPIPWRFGRFAFVEDASLQMAGDASWYSYKGCLCAASPDYQKGDKVQVVETTSGKSVVVTINDYGPDRTVFPNRVIDLDKTAFRRLTNLTNGILKVMVLPI